VPDGDDYTLTIAEARRLLDALYDRFGAPVMARIIAAKIEARKTGRGHPPNKGDGPLLFEMYRIMANERCRRAEAARLLTRGIQNQRDRIAVRRRLKRKFPEGLFGELQACGLGDDPAPLEFVAALLQVAVIKMQRLLPVATILTPDENDRHLKEHRNLAHIMLGVFEALKEVAE